MTDKFKHRRRASDKANRSYGDAMARKIAKHDAGLSNRHGGGCLLPSQLGWGQHKADKNRISLFDPWSGGRP